MAQSGKPQLRNLFRNESIRTLWVASAGSILAFLVMMKKKNMRREEVNKYFRELDPEALREELIAVGCLTSVGKDDG